MTLDNFYCIVLPVSIFLTSWFILLKYSPQSCGWIFVISLTSLWAAKSSCIDYRTAYSLPCDFSKHGFLTSFHFRNTYLLVHPILLCYKDDFLYNRWFTKYFTVPFLLHFHIIFYYRLLMSWNILYTFSCCVLEFSWGIKELICLILKKNFCVEHSEF